MNLPYIQLALFSCIVLLQACSGDSGGGGSDRDPNVQSASGGGQFAYVGPVPASDEIQSFKISFYDNLVDSDRCGDCHTSGGVATAFVDRDDVNYAWRLASSLVDLQDPANSAVVQKVAGGHNCWLGAEQTASCAATITAYIERWGGGSSESSSEVSLLPRNPVIPTGSKSMPADFNAAQALAVDLTATGELMELLTRYCSSCHSNTAAIAQSPYFASSDPDIAYPALNGKIDLINPDKSRLVLRLENDSHNCWSDCDANAATLEAAIAKFSSNLADVIEVDPNLLTSMAQVLETDGIVASSGGRYESDMIAKWEFREGEGSTIADTSGVQPEIPLTLAGDYAWMSSWGVRFTNGKAQGGVAASTKLYELITATGEYTIEAWIAPNNVSQEEAWIAGYAGSASSRNLLLSQTLYNYELYNRSSATDDNGGGMPALSTDDDDELAQATLQHVVVTFDPVRGRRIYVNGEFSGDDDASGGGLLNGWNESFAFVLGNTPGFNFPWAGAIRMAAVYNRKLSDEQILQNFDVGVGQKYFLMFSVSELLNQENVCHIIAADLSRTNYCYVVYEVSQLDDNSYLFDSPFFVNINPDPQTLNFDLRGIRLGINGKLAVSGQGFLNVDAVVDSELFGPMGQVLSPMGSIIALENGASADIFFLAFENIDGTSDTTASATANNFTYTLSGEASPDIAMRTFDEINQSLALLTGVPSSSPVVSNVTGKTVSQTYEIIRRQLPGIANFQTYMSSHQMAVTQLAAAYCDALVEDDVRRNAIFSPAFNLQDPVAGISYDKWRVDIVEPLVDRSINTGLLIVSQRQNIIDEVLMLITDDRNLKPYSFVGGSYVSDPDTKKDGLVYCDNDATCPASRTTEVVKAACTTVLGSALVIMQ